MSSSINVYTVCIPHIYHYAQFYKKNIYPNFTGGTLICFLTFYFYAIAADLYSSESESLEILHVVLYTLELYIYMYSGLP